MKAAVVLAVLALAPGPGGEGPAAGRWQVEGFGMSGITRVTGEYAGQGVTCPQFRLDTGETISLSGAVPELTPGRIVTLHGRWQTISKCMQGREFRVIPQETDDTQGADRT